jgi:hypothetical protein
MPTKNLWQNAGRRYGMWSDRAPQPETLGWWCPMREKTGSCERSFTSGARANSATASGRLTPEVKRGSGVRENR